MICALVARQADTATSHAERRAELHVERTVEQEIEGEITDLEEIGEGARHHEAFGVDDTSPDEVRRDVHQLGGTDEDDVDGDDDDQRRREPVARRGPQLGAGGAVALPDAHRFPQRSDEARVEEREQHDGQAEPDDGLRPEERHTRRRDVAEGAEIEQHQARVTRRGEVDGAVLHEGWHVAHSAANVDGDASAGGVTSPHQPLRLHRVTDRDVVQRRYEDDQPRADQPERRHQSRAVHLVVHPGIARCKQRLVDRNEQPREGARAVEQIGDGER